MTGFVKLDCGMLNSTIWMDRPAREVFITALLMAEPREFTAGVPQIEVRTLDFTGWSAPPGWYGFVPAAGVGIIGRAGIEIEAGLAALERLGSPEAESRNPAFDGRRMIRIDGGYLILNFARYRERDYTATQRSRRFRERRKQNGETPLRHGETPLHHGETPLRHGRQRRATQAEAEAEAEADPDKSLEPGFAGESDTPPVCRELDPQRRREAFEVVRANYPRGLYRANAWLHAEINFCRCLDDGLGTLAELVEAATAYGLQQEAAGNVGGRFIMSPSRFYDPREGHFRGPFPKPRSKAEAQQDQNLDASLEWLRQQEVKDATG